MTGKLGWLTFDMELQGKGTNARMRLSLMSPGVAEEGCYQPAESVMCSVWRPEDLEAICNALAEARSHLSERATKP